MRAVVSKKYGGPGVLTLMDLNKPVPKKDEILIKINATTVTVADIRLRAFDVPPSFWLPARFALGLFKLRNDVLGMEIAGVVEATGDDVTTFKAGDRVFGMTFDHRFGGYAEYKCLPEKSAVVPIPGEVSDCEAAAICMGGITAYYYLKKGDLQPGQTILINGASGSVGTFAVQLAKQLGGVVTAVCGPNNIELVKSLGADRVIDYTREDCTGQDIQYDFVFDAVGKLPLNRGVKILKRGGNYVHTVSAPGMATKMTWYQLTGKGRFIGGVAQGGKEEITYLAKLVQEGKLKVVIDQTYPLEEIVAAHRYVDQGHKKGNVIITV